MRDALRTLLAVAMFSSTTSAQDSGFTVEFDKDTLEIVEPFQREVSVWATIRNTTRGEDVIRVSIVGPSSQASRGGLVHLDAGETVRHQVAHIEQRMAEPGDAVTLDVRMESSRRSASVFQKRITVRFARSAAGMLHAVPMTLRVFDAETKGAIRRAVAFGYVGPDSRTEKSRVEADGRLVLALPKAEALGHIAATHGIEWSGCTVEVQAEGYATRVLTRLKPAGAASQDVYLDPLPEPARFRADWLAELKFPGVWRVRPSKDWRFVAVALGKHPDPWDRKGPVPTVVVLFTAGGECLWKYAVDDAVWGMDIAPDGSRVVAGTHGGQLVMIDREGKLLWSKRTRSNLREIRFSNDGTRVAGETSSRLEVLDARTGAVVADCDAGIDTHWRGVAFGADDRRAVFAGAGALVMVDVAAKRPLWHGYVAQVPYDVRITADFSRLVVADKGGNVWCVTTRGEPVWHRGGIAVLTDMDMTDDGSRTAVLSHDGTIRVFDRDGELLWRRAVGFAGHNALDMTGDGRRIVVGGGTREEPYAVFVFDADGNLLWKHSEPGPMPDPYHPYQSSAMTVAVSEDGSRIVAGYGTGRPAVQFFSAERSPERK